MAHEIKRLKNGRYSVYSTVADGVILKNATREEIIEFEVNLGRDTIVAMVNRLCDRADRETEAIANQKSKI